MTLSLYVHIPFCQRKCPYCDFNTYAGLSRLFEPLAAALVGEIEAAGAARGCPPVRTIFIGGGTPTVLPPALLAQVLDACRRAFAVRPDAEITSEANPGAVDAGCFAALRQMGVNRLSMGVQSFDDDELRFLGRIHGAAEAQAAFQSARASGFDNINLDFIFGLPRQSPAAWRETLQRAMALQPEHLSLYSLIVEEGTPFAEWAAAGRFPQPDPDLAADLYDLAAELLAAAGYAHYEISNWARDDKQGDSERAAPAARPRFACRHNLTYWRNEPYLGFGPGAHSFEHGRRWANVLPVAGYIERAGVSPVDWAEPIDSRLAMGETMMLGLRLLHEGVALARFEQRHGRPLLQVFAAEVAELERLGLIERLADRVRLTPQARLLGNQVFARFLP